MAACPKDTKISGVLTGDAYDIGYQAAHQLVQGVAKAGTGFSTNDIGMLASGFAVGAGRVAGLIIQTDGGCGQCEQINFLIILQAALNDAVNILKGENPHAGAVH